jgi:hypothetical protein
MTFLTSIFSLFGCKSKEDKFLQENNIYFYGTPEFENYEKNAPVKLTEAWEIQKKYANLKNQIAENWLFFIVNDNYIFCSALNPIQSRAFLKGIWVNSKTGGVRYNNLDQNLKYKKAYNGDGENFPF